jgi:hypothetical protein
MDGRNRGHALTATAEQDGWMITCDQGPKPRFGSSARPAP